MPINKDFTQIPISKITRESLRQISYKGETYDQLLNRLLEASYEESYVYTKTPLRLPLGGGGSDLPEYYSKFGGFWLSATITNYIRIILKKRFEKESKFVWSQTEYVKDSSQFSHPILRAVLTKHNLVNNIELVSMGDLPARIGLGSSGAFTVGLLNAVHSFKNSKVTPQNLAEEAYEIERYALGRKIGKQDQYIASEGGLREFHVNKQGQVSSNPLRVNSKLFEKWLLLFYVNQRETSAENAIKTLTIEDYQKTSELTNKFYESLQNNDFMTYGMLLDEHWQTKKKGQPKRFSELVDLTKSQGAIGSKLCGAGNGGCILTVCPPEKQVNIIETLQKQGLRHIPFRFTNFGTEAY